ncbi:cellulose synthase complex outer membrane protein BcsC [Pseudomonas sp.]|uniref:cellulose synthase complex outer membrane protein BcsC n=1 Tax=Pseudomonas sp. TaxID=306 RepID=UPI00272F28AC|nr:cellulose synthase complex outer membrane protein BcsC [Pseudomonas sp.]MDP2246068.1 cellulose synthase complex outer membrane protein BcsC [Pseudomonas sp.]
MTRHLPLALLLLSTSIHAIDVGEARLQLLEQVRTGESRNKVELIEESLYRLFKLNPDDPDGLAALIRLQVRKNQLTEAQASLERLNRSAPDSEPLAHARLHLAINEPEAKQHLQQARLLARAGRPEEALAVYDSLFKHGFPSSDHALEYWQALANAPTGQARALQGLEQLVEQYPYSSSFRLALARQRLARDPYSEAAHADLEKLSSDPYARAGVASVWQDRLERLPVNERSAALWRRYLTQYPEADEIARQSLAEQEALLGNPSFQAKQRALGNLESGSQAYPAIERDLQLALKGFPTDSQTLGALGLLRQRQGRQQEALTLYEQARSHEENIDNMGKWQTLITESRFWATLKEAEVAVEQGQLERAAQLYQQAATLKSNAAEPHNGLGYIQARRNDMAGAERHYQAALARDRNNAAAKRGLINLYSASQPERAREIIATLPADQRQRFEPELNRLQAAQLTTQAQQHADQQRWATAKHLLDQALRLQPDNPWIAYDLAKARVQLDDPAAEQSFAGLLLRAPYDPASRYAHSLFLASQDRPQQALASLATVPRTTWDDGMRALDRRLRFAQTMDNARQMHAQGREHAASDYLKAQQRHFPEEVAIPLTLGEWAERRGNRAEAERQYRLAQQLEPHNSEAELSLIELAQQRRDTDVQQRLDAFAPATPSPSQQRRIANLWLQLGEQTKAEQAMIQARLAAPQDPWIWRDSGRLALAGGQPQEALAAYREAMRSSGIALASEDTLAFTRSTRSNDEDDWLKRSIRRDSAELYLHQAPTATVQYSYLESKGTPGFSDLQAGYLIAEVAQPLGSGRGFLRAEQVTMDSGSFDNLLDADDFGSVLICQQRGEACDQGDRNQREAGTALAIGWRGERLEWDIGTTPLGFPVEDVVGGIRIRGDLAKLGWTLDVSRRALNNSLLSFAGTEDPRTGETWGGVRSNGIRLGLSYDEGGSYGIWSSLQAHRLTGKNVEDNDRYRLMAGVYFRIIDEPDRRLRIGGNAMYWHYQKDLSGYTFGQGGYYSPQQYRSLSVPINYAQRWGDWSIYAEASTGFSWSRNDDSPYFPTRRDLQSEAGNPIFQGGRSDGFSYRFSFSAERRLTPNWFVGGMLGMERSVGSDYEPRGALLYLRYSFAPWDGDLKMPLEPLEEYAQFN